MKKIVKVLLIALGVLLLVAIILPWLFRGRIVEAIKTEANKQVNARIEFKSVGATLFRNFPELTISLHELWIHGIDRFDQQALFQAKRLDLTVKLWNVFKGSPYEIQRVKLESADIQLLVLEDGTVNWDIMPEDTSAEADVPIQEGSVSLKLQQLTFSNSRLKYEDRELIFVTELNGVNGGLSGDISLDNSKLQLNLKADRLDVAYEKIPILAGVGAVFKGKIDANLTESVYAVKSEQMLLNALNVIFGGVFHLKDDAIGIEMSFNAPDGDFKQLLSLFPAIYANQFDQVRASGSFSFGGYMSGDYSEHSFPSFGMSLTIGDGGFSYPGMPSSMEKIMMSMKIENPTGNFDHTRIDMDRFSFLLGQNPFSMTLGVRTPVSDPQIESSMQGKMNLADLQGLLPEGAIPVMKGRLEADFGLKAAKSDIENKRYSQVMASGHLHAYDVELPSEKFAEAIRLEHATLDFNPSFIQTTVKQLRMGQSDFTLEGKVEDYLPYYLGNGTLSASLNVKSGMLDANELMKTFLSDTTRAEGPADEHALQLPERIRAVLTASVGKLLFQQYDLSNVEAVVDYRDQRLVLQPLKAEMLGGIIEMKGSFDGRNAKAAPVDFDFAIRDFDIPMAYQTIGLFQAAAPIAGKTKGRFSTSFRLKGLLDDQMNPIFESLQGGGGLQSSQITVESVSVMNTLASLMGNDSYRRLITDGVNLSFEFLNGRVYQKPFGLKYGNADVTMSGSVGFDKLLDYDMVFQLPFSSLGTQVADGIKGLASRAAAGGIALQPGTSVQVKARITGTVTDPKVSLDYKDFAGNLKADLSRTALQEIDKQKEQLRQQAKDEAARLIADAQARSKTIVDEAETTAARIRNEASAAAQKLTTEADNQAEKLIAEGKARGMIAERAAQEAARKLKQQADQSARNIEQEADRRATQIVSEANKQADRIVEEAERKAAAL